MLNYGDPRYTETFLQFQENNPNALEDIIVMSTTDRSNALINMLKAKYNVYEISAPNEALFIQYLKDTFNCSMICNIFSFLCHISTPNNLLYTQFFKK